MYKIMRSKFDIIRSLKGKRVLDIGGVGYAGNSVRERLLQSAWADVNRTILDIDPRADLVMDLNANPLPLLHDSYDVAVALDVLEHVKNPGLVLAWIPTQTLWINVPTATSLNCQRIERESQRVIPECKHLYSFNMLTIKNLVESCSWKIEEAFYTLDTQSALGVAFSAVASLAPYWTSMGIALKCRR